MIGRSGERGSGISVQAARHYDDDDVLSFRARVDLGAMAIEVCAIFPKAVASLEPQHKIV